MPITEPRPDAPFFIVLNAGIKLVAIQVLRQIDEIGHAGCMFAAVNDGLKFL